MTKKELFEFHAGVHEVELTKKLKKLGNFYHTGTDKVYKHKKTLKKYHWLSSEKYLEFLQRIFNDINDIK